MTKYKRLFRKALKENDEKGFDPSLIGIAKFFFAVALIAFMVTQLITNAILSPLGHELQSLNQEKNMLLEDNRLLEQVIAKDTSLTIIKVYSEDQFDITSDSEYRSIFVSDQSIQASNE